MEEEKFNVTKKTLPPTGSGSVLTSESSGATEKKTIAKVTNEADNKRKDLSGLQMPKWKEKLTHVFNLFSRIGEKRTGVKMDNEDVQMLSSEWSDVLNDYGVSPPKGVRLIIAIIVTVAIVANTYWAAIAKIKAVGKKKEEEPARSVSGKKCTCPDGKHFNAFPTCPLNQK